MGRINVTSSIFAGLSSPNAETSLLWHWSGAGYLFSASLCAYLLSRLCVFPKCARSVCCRSFRTPLVQSSASSFDLCIYWSLTLLVARHGLFLTCPLLEQIVDVLGSCFFNKRAGQAILLASALVRAQGASTCCLSKGSFQVLSELR